LGITGSEVTTDRQEVSVEHIAPQNPDGNYWYEKIAPQERNLDSTAVETKFYEDYIYSWGNITILERKLNASVRNGTWDIKKNGQGRYKGYKDSSIAATSDLISISDWNSQTLESRTIWFANQALKFWSKSLQELRTPRLDRFTV
jgi:hypothetical protein